MTDMTRPTAVHLVGSIGLDTVEDVFRTIGKTLGPYLRRAPDGEVGGLGDDVELPAARVVAQIAGADGQGELV